MQPPEAWRRRTTVLRAMALLCLARLLVAFVPFKLWRGWLGQVAAPDHVSPTCPDIELARWLAHCVERAAARLPGVTKCLPQSMALAWLLRRAELPYSLKIAMRPPGARGDDDTFHAWLETGGEAILGELPGAWAVTLMLTDDRKAP